MLILTDLINNQKIIKEDFLKTYSKSDDVQNNTNYIHKIKHFDFEDILCDFIPYAISSTYRQIIPNEMDSISIQKYYGIIMQSQEYYEIQRMQAINYLYTLPDYCEQFNKIIFNYIDNDFECCDTILLLTQYHRMPLCGVRIHTLLSLPSPHGRVILY